jgi:hypothetical protein
LKKLRNVRRSDAMRSVVDIAVANGHSL